jgi:putative membrane protein
MAADPKLARSADKIESSVAHLENRTARMAGSTARMEGSTARMEDSADRRTELAADRTVFAAERTYAAWVRTGLMALASGVGAKKLLADILPEWLIIATGSVLVLFSAFCFGAAVWRHLYPGPPPPRPDAPRIHPAALILVNGLLGLAALAALLGIWFGRSGA